MADRTEIAKLLGIFGVAYPRHALSASQLAQAVPVWEMLLGDLDFGLLEAAAHKHCTTSQWFPSIAEIRSLALDMLRLPGAVKTAGEAWEEVRLALSRGEHGYRKGHYAWSSALVERAFNGVGGWQYFNTALMETAMADRAHFMRIYGELVERSERERREAPAVTAYRRMLLGDGAAEEGARRARMIGVEVDGGEHDLQD